MHNSLSKSDELRTYDCNFKVERYSSPHLGIMRLAIFLYLQPATYLLSRLNARTRCREIITRRIFSVSNLVFHFPCLIYRLQYFVLANNIRKAAAKNSTKLY